MCKIGDQAGVGVGAVAVESGGAVVARRVALVFDCWWLWAGVEPPLYGRPQNVWATNTTGGACQGGVTAAPRVCCQGRPPAAGLRAFPAVAAFPAASPRATR